MQENDNLKAKSLPQGSNSSKFNASLQLYPIHIIYHPFKLYKAAG